MEHRETSEERIEEDLVMNSLIEKIGTSQNADDVFQYAIKKGHTRYFPRLAHSFVFSINVYNYAVQHENKEAIDYLLGWNEIKPTFDEFLHMLKLAKSVNMKEFVYDACLLLELEQHEAMKLPAEEKE
jgi:hypothetical protein